MTRTLSHFPRILFSLAGGFAIAFGLLWMMQWFRAKSFVKIEQAPLAIDRRWSWVMIAAVVVLIDVLILGRTIYF